MTTEPFNLQQVANRVAPGAIVRDQNTFLQYLKDKWGEWSETTGAGIVGAGQAIGNVFTPFDRSTPVDTNMVNNLLAIPQATQSFTEQILGTLGTAAAGYIPGEQAIERNTRLAQEQGLSGFNALQRGWQNTDLPSARVNLIPGSGINLPGDATLNEVDFGVKGALEMVADPLNVLPAEAVAAPLTRLAGRGVKKAASAVPTERLAGAIDRVSPIGTADATFTPDDPLKKLEAEVAALRKMPGRKTELAAAEQAVSVPEPRAVQDVLGPSASKQTVETAQQVARQKATDVFMESRQARQKLRVAIELFSKPMARTARTENAAVLRQRVAQGMSNAQKAMEAGEYQTAARIRQAAQRGPRVTETTFEPLARRADPNNPYSDVVGRGDNELISSDEINLLHKQVATHFLNKRMPLSANNAQFALNKVLLGERLQDAEIKMLEESLGIGRQLTAREGSKRFQTVLDVLAIPKTLRSSIDMSGYLRQAGFYVFNVKNLSPSEMGAARRKTTADAMKIMFRAFKDKDKVANDVWADLQTRNPQLFDAVVSSPTGNRLHLYAPSEASLAARDEAFMSTMFNRMAGVNIRAGSPAARLAKLPVKVIGEGVTRSEIAFTSMLNRIRFDAVEQLVKDAERIGGNIIDPKTGEVLNQQFLDAVTNWANITTGRGNLSVTVAGRTANAEGLGPLLNGVFWAPRLATARAETLIRGPVNVAREAARIAKTGDVGVRNLTPEQLAIRRTAEEFVGFLAAGITILTLGKLAKEAGMPGFDTFTTELDPRSSDFGKGRFGDTRYDFWGGHQQFVRTLAQITSGKRKTTTTGELVDTNFAETNWQFIRSKLAPGLPTLATSEVARGTFLGEELSLPADLLSTDIADRNAKQLGVGEQVTGALQGKGSVRTRDIAQQLIPLTIMEYVDIMRDRGLVEGAFMSIPPWFGAGAQTFGGAEK